MTDSARGIHVMVRRIVAGFHPERIILFGSHARGEAGPDSDVDVLVVMRISGSRREQRVAIRAALADLPFSKDVVVATPDELEWKGAVPGTLLNPVLREGRTLYVRGQRTAARR